MVRVSARTELTKHWVKMTSVVFMLIFIRYLSKINQVNCFFCVNNGHICNVP